MSKSWADTVRVHDGWRTTLYRRVGGDAAKYYPALIFVTPADLGFEGPAERLREEGFDIASWGAGTDGGFRAELIPGWWTS